MMSCSRNRLAVVSLGVLVLVSAVRARGASDVTAKSATTAGTAATPPATSADAKAYLAIDAPSAVLLTNSLSGGRVGEGARATDADLEQPELYKPSRAERKLSHEQEEAQRNTDCEEHYLNGKPCRVSWIRIIPESVEFLAAQHTGNIYMDNDTRHNLTTRPFWATYINCVDNYRWSRWKDDDPFGVDYIGHPMMGALTNSIYEQNDPKQRALTYENSGRYWFGRLRATAYSAVYSTQWKIGPASEASIGNTGVGYYVRNRDGIITNETGMQDFFVTPIGGLAWNVGEDALDKYIVSHIRHAHPRNMPLLILASVITPLKSAANLTRFRAMYYRDYDNYTLPNRTR